MWNEFLLIGSLFVIFGGLLLFYRLFGIIGIYCWSIFATIAANIEVLLVVDISPACFCKSATAF